MKTTISANGEHIAFEGADGARCCMPIKHITMWSVVPRTVQPIQKEEEWFIQYGDIKAKVTIEVWHEVYEKIMGLDIIVEKDKDE